MDMNYHTLFKVGIYGFENMDIKVDNMMVKNNKKYPRYLETETFKKNKEIELFVYF